MSGRRRARSHIPRILVGGRSTNSSIPAAQHNTCSEVEYVGSIDRIVRIPQLIVSPADGGHPHHSSHDNPDSAPSTGGLSREPPPAQTGTTLSGRHVRFRSSTTQYHGSPVVAGHATVRHRASTDTHGIAPAPGSTGDVTDSDGITRPEGGPQRRKTHLVNHTTWSPSIDTSHRPEWLKGQLGAEIQDQIETQSKLHPPSPSRRGTPSGSPSPAGSPVTKTPLSHTRTSGISNDTEGVGERSPPLLHPSSGPIELAPGSPRSTTRSRFGQMHPYTLAFFDDRTEQVFEGLHMQHNMRAYQLIGILAGIFSLTWAIWEVNVSETESPTFTLKWEKFGFIVGISLCWVAAAGSLETKWGQTHFLAIRNFSGTIITLVFTTFQTIDVVGNGNRYMYGIYLAFWASPVIIQQPFRHACITASLSFVLCLSQMLLTDHFSLHLSEGSDYVLLDFVGVFAIGIAGLTGLYFRERDARSNFVLTMKKTELARLRSEKSSEVSSLMAKMFPAKIAQQFDKAEAVALWNRKQHPDAHGLFHESMCYNCSDAAVLVCAVSNFQQRVVTGTEVPAKLVSNLNKVFSSITSLALRLDADLYVKTQGYHMIIVSGLLAETPSPAATLAQVAADIRSYLDRKQEVDPRSFDVACGLEYGPIHAGLLASSYRLDFDLLEGYTIANARRLAGIANQGDVLVSEVVRDLISSGFEVESDPELEALRIYALKGKRADATQLSFSQVLASATPIDFSHLLDVRVDTRGHLDNKELHHSELGTELEVWVDSNAVSLGFVDQDIEQEYREQLARRAKPVLRFNAALALVFVCLGGAQDKLVTDIVEDGTAELRTMLMLRYLGLLPIFLMIFGVTYYRYLHRVLQAVNGILVLGAGVCVLYMISAAPPVTTSAIATAFLRILTTTFTRLRLRFINATIVASLLVGLYMVIPATHTRDFWDRRFMLYVIFFTVFGSIVSRILEKGSRALFLSRRAVRNEEVLLLNTIANLETLYNTLLPFHRNCDPLGRAKALGQKWVSDMSSAYVITITVGKLLTLDTDTSQEQGVAYEPPSREEADDFVLFDAFNRIFAEFDDLAHRYEVTTIRTIGNMYVVVGGVNQVGNDLPSDPWHSCKNVLQFTKECVERTVLAGRAVGTGDQFSAHVGVAVGPVTVGVMSSATSVFDAFGSAAELSKSLSMHAGAGTVLASNDFIQDASKLGLLDDISVKRCEVLLDESDPSSVVDASLWLPRQANDKSMDTPERTRVLQPNFDSNAPRPPSFFEQHSRILDQEDEDLLDVIDLGDGSH